MYTIYMVWRSTTSNYNQSEILNYTCGCFLVRSLCRGVHFISSSLHKLLSVYNTCDIYFWWYTIPIHNTTITCLADIYKSFKTKLNLYASNVTLTLNQCSKIKKTVPWWWEQIAHKRFKYFVKWYIYQCYRTYVLGILQKKTYMYMYDMCGSKGVE